MTDSEILEIVNSYQSDYKNYKDGGLSEIKQLALALKRADNNERSSIINFFLREIAHDKNKLGSLCLQVIIFSDLNEVAPELKSIYLKFSEDKDVDWRESLVSAMMDLHYSEPLELYQEAIKWHLSNHSGRAFFLIAKYCLIDKSGGMGLLSKYYLENLLSTECFEYKNSHHIGYLISIFAENNNIDYFSELLNNIMREDKKSGLLLKDLISDYISNHPANKFRKSILNEINKVKST